MSETELKIVSTEFRLPGDSKWMKAVSKWPMTKEEQIRRIKLTWGNKVEIREQGLKDS